MRFEIAKAARTGLLSLGVATSTLLAGCGDFDSAPTTMPTYSVKGRMVLPDGKPLTTGSVVFTLPEKGMEFEGPLQSDGSFSLKSPFGDGAPEGSYLIRLRADSTGSSGTTSRRAVAKLAFPARYGDETTSGLTAVVKPSPNDLGTITLTK